MKIGLPILLILAIAFGFTHKKDEKPNVLFIMVDDLRPELNAFGATHIQSPNIDKLASESANFKRAFCNVPVCGASRASLMSGVRPGRFRFLTAETRLNEHYPDIKSMPSVFHDNGYTTISNGKIYHYSNDDKSSWTEIWTPEKNTPRDFVG
jgi:iduronate 2-sulfatase